MRPVFFGIGVFFALNLQGCISGIDAPRSGEDVRSAAELGLILVIVTSIVIPLWITLSVLWFCNKCPKRVQDIGMEGPTEVRFPRQVAMMCVLGLCPVLAILANILSWILYSWNTNKMTCESLAALEPQLCLSWKQPYGDGFSASDCCIWSSVILSLLYIDSSKSLHHSFCMASVCPGSLGTNPSCVHWAPKNSETSSCTLRVKKALLNFNFFCSEMKVVYPFRWLNRS